MVAMFLAQTTAGLTGLGTNLLARHQKLPQRYIRFHNSTSGFEDRRKGMASGWHESSLAMGCGAGGLLGGILGTWLGSRVPYYFCALVLGLSATAQMTIYLFMRRRWLQK